MEKEVVLIITEDEYKSLSSDFRKSCKYVRIKEANEYEKHKDDKMYMQLYKASKKAKDDLSKYLFKKQYG